MRRNLLISATIESGFLVHFEQDSSGKAFGDGEMPFHQVAQGAAERLRGGGRPWEHLDRTLAAALEPELPALADEVIAEIAAAVPDYRRPLEGGFGRGIRVGVQRSLQQFVDLIGRAEGVSASSREVYRELGRGELRAGRALDALQAAYRLGARLSWRRLSEVARSKGANAEQVSLLAESVFAYIEEVSGSSVEGYAEAQADLAGERERRRRRLVRMLVQDGGAAVAGEPEAMLRAAANEAGWKLPGAVAAIACAAPDASRLTTLLGGGAIAAPLDDVTCVLLPGAQTAGGHQQVLDALRRLSTLAGAACVAAIGPTVPTPEAHVSFARASEALRLQRAGALPDQPLIVASEHLLTLLLHRDATLTAQLKQARLAPLSKLTPRSRARLQETLLSWLRHGGAVVAVAAELHVHRQTVRYRLKLLRDAFGADLDDPDRRLELELALRWSASRKAARATERAAATVANRALRQ